MFGNYIMCVIIRKLISWNYCEGQVLVRYDIVQIYISSKLVFLVVALLYFHINGAALVLVHIPLVHSGMQVDRPAYRTATCRE